MCVNVAQLNVNCQLRWVLFEIYAKLVACCCPWVVNVDVYTTTHYQLRTFFTLYVSWQCARVIDLWAIDFECSIHYMVNPLTNFSTHYPYLSFDGLSHSHKASLLCNFYQIILIVWWQETVWTTCPMSLPNSRTAGRQTHKLRWR